MKTSDITKTRNTLKTFVEFSDMIKDLKKSEIVRVAQSMSERGARELEILDNELKARGQ